MAYTVTRRSDGGLVVSSSTSRRLKLSWWLGFFPVAMANSVLQMLGPSGLHRSSLGERLAFWIAVDVLLIIAGIALNGASGILILAPNEVQVVQCVCGHELWTKRQALGGRPAKFRCESNWFTSWLSLEGGSIAYSGYLEKGDAWQLAELLNAEASAQSV